MCGRIVQATSPEEFAREFGVVSALEHGSLELHRCGGPGAKAVAPARLPTLSACALREPGCESCSGVDLRDELSNA
jgi:hypothetical protein